MVYAVVGQLAFQNVSRRNNALNFVTNRLQVENLFGPVIAEATTSKSGNPALSCMFRFVSEAARDTFYIDLIAALAGANGPIVGSWVSKHGCTHDEPVPVSCAESERQTF